MIAWVTHHLPLPDGTLVGGAEMTDQRMLAIAPEPVQVFGPSNWQGAMDYEKVIITGTDLLSVRAMSELSKKNPTVVVHHKQTRTPARAALINSASKFICHTPRHLEIELEWTSPKASTWVLSQHDSTEFQSREKQDFALWAARMHPQKGPDNALKWSAENGIPLLMYSDKTRAEVLEAMSRAKYFVFLPNHFDAEPRTLIEAVLSGCEVITNNMAGISSIPNWQDYETMRQLVERSGELFWQEALSQ